MSFNALQHKVTQNVKLFLRITQWKTRTVLYVQLLIVLTIIANVFRNWSEMRNTYIHVVWLFIQFNRSVWLVKMSPPVPSLTNLPIKTIILVIHSVETHHVCELYTIFWWTVLSTRAVCAIDYNVNSFNQLRKTAIASYLASPVRQFKLDGLVNSINKDRLWNLCSFTNLTRLTFKLVEPISLKCPAYAVRPFTLVIHETPGTNSASLHNFFSFALVGYLTIFTAYSSKQDSDFLILSLFRSFK